jgi:hypothetical protein
MKRIIGIVNLAILVLYFAAHVSATKHGKVPEPDEPVANCALTELSDRLERLEQSHQSVTQLAEVPCVVSVKMK